MKKSKSIFYYSMIIVSSLFFMIGVLRILHLLPLDISNSLSYQPNTKWYSEDGKIYFEIDKNGHGVGTLKSKDDIIDIHFMTGPGMSYDRITISPVIGNINNKIIEIDIIESWDAKFVRKDKFIAYVDDYTTHYEIGDKIVFYRK